MGRSLKILSLTVKAGARAATHAVGTLFSDKATARQRRDAFMTAQFDDIVEELGKLKGSLMKVGQLISMYGDYFFPPKFNKILKHLQADSTPVSWAALDRQLTQELGADYKSRLNVDETAYAAASLGQVHLAKIPDDERQLCVKVQYPGIDSAVESDLRALKPLLKLFRSGHGARFDDLLAEFRLMLETELDYIQERTALDAFRSALKSDVRYSLPESIPEFCTRRVLTTSFMPGVAPDDPTVVNLPQSRRNMLGGALLDLYFFEIFTMRNVQTDPHFGNFRVQVGAADGADTLVLLDFGSMRRVSDTFAKIYGEYIAGAYVRDEQRVINAALSMGLLVDSDGPAVRRELFELTGVLMEPLRIAESGKTTGRERELEDMPDLIAAKTRRFVDKIGMRPPPRELLLLDRKLLGVFVFLATLRALVPGREIIGRYVTL